MPMIPLLLGWLAATSAHAAEVVWLTPPLPELAAHVAEASGARGAPLVPEDLRCAASAWGPADDAAYRVLDDTLREVRRFETRLDGELLIMRDLDAPIRGVSLLRDEADRDKLFAALAYQGFAVDRFFMEGLATDARAEAYRVELSGLALERPWMDAVALAPDRAVTPYDIAEAPQRIAYEEVRREVRGALPGEIRVLGLPEGAFPIIDGVRQKPSAAGGYRVVPGRHLVHVAWGDRILARWDVRLEPAGRVELVPAVSEAAWRAFIDAIASGGSPALPEGLEASIAAMGGEVWIARVDERGAPSAVRLTSGGVAPVSLPRRTTTRSDAEGGFSLAGGLGAGWLYSGDFYTQDPSVPHTVATVNAVAADLHVEIAWDAGLFRGVAGLDAWIPFGANHVALSGERALRIRPAPFLAAGVRWAQVTGGILLPYHPFVGLQASIPLYRGLEIRAAGLYGFGMTLGRADGSTYDAQRLHTVTVGAAWRQRAVRQ